MLIGKKINYVIFIVGYGIYNNIFYWIIKNFWGKLWGDGGYIKIVMKSDRCGFINGLLLVIKKDVLIVEYFFKIFKKLFK